MGIPLNVLLQLNVLLFVLQWPHEAHGETKIRIEKFEQCPDKLNMPNIFSRTRATQAALNDVAIDGSIFVRQDIVEPATLLVKLYKCASKDAPDSCEYYYTYKNDNFCKMIAMDGMPWTDFWFQTTLPRACPVPPGNYSMNGARIKMAGVPDAPFLYGYWKIRSTGKSAGKAWHCAIAEFSLGEEMKTRKKGKHRG